MQGTLDHPFALLRYPVDAHPQYLGADGAWHNDNDLYGM